MISKRVIFVFGSNLGGRHGKGAALHAKKYYGAEYGVGQGPTGDSYAIPTKDVKLKTLPLERIKLGVDTFIEYARNNSTLQFELTEIGCGLAGYSPEDIAPMFKDAPSNVMIPKAFREILEKDDADRLAKTKHP